MGGGSKEHGGRGDVGEGQEKEEQDRDGKKKLLIAYYLDFEILKKKRRNVIILETEW